MIEMHNQEFQDYYLSLPGVRPWYYLFFGILPRAFAYQGMIFLNVDAFFLNAHDKQLIIDHEQGHLDGKEHTWTGIMSAYGVVRYLTS
jgi:hypothetical protein